MGIMISMILKVNIFFHIIARKINRIIPNPVKKHNVIMLWELNKYSLRNKIGKKKKIELITENNIG